MHVWMRFQTRKLFTHHKRLKLYLPRKNKNIEQNGFRLVTIIGKVFSLCGLFCFPLALHFRLFSHVVKNDGMSLFFICFYFLGMKEGKRRKDWYRNFFMKRCGNLKYGEFYSACTSCFNKIHHISKIRMNCSVKTESPIEAFKMKNFC